MYVVGGSFVESIYAHPRDRFVARAAHSTTCANILNAGYSGMTTLHIAVIVFAKLGGLAKPGDVVVAFTPKSDSVSLTWPGGYWTGANNTYYSPVVPAKPNTRPTQDTDYLAIVRGIKAFLSTIGVRLVLATSPHRKIDYPNDTWLHAKRTETRIRQLEASQDRLDNWTREAAADLDVTLLDMHALCKGDPTLFYDEYHLNAHGQKEVGALFTRLLHDHGIVASN